MVLFVGEELGITFLNHDAAICIDRNNAEEITGELTSAGVVLGTN